MRRKRQAGFTLLEVLFATIILAGAMMVITLAWSGNTLRIRKANMMNNAVALLERKTTELQAKFQNKPFAEIVSEEGDFGSEHQNYRWTFEAQEFEVPDMSSAIVGEDKGSNPMLEQIVKQVSEYLSKSIKEGKVTVYVKSGGKETPFSITTYFVDYNSTVPLPGQGG